LKVEDLIANSDAWTKTFLAIAAPKYGEWKILNWEFWTSPASVDINQLPV
jgi:hypothetical protein